MTPFLIWLETTPLAASVRESLGLTAVLSATHVLGFTLVMGGALLANLRLAGALLGDRAAVSIIRPAHRAIALGLLVSIPTGLALLSPRAVSAFGNPTFRFKMAFLLAAVAGQPLIARALGRASVDGAASKLAGLVGLSLWVALAVSACAFILLE